MLKLPAEIPTPHRQFLASTAQLQGDQRIVGVAAGGSFISNAMDEFSDLDLVIAIEPTHYDEVMKTRHVIAASLGRLLTCYTGEHLGEPRLLICLYDEPLLIVDMCFVSLDAVLGRTENPIVLWDRAGRFKQALNVETADFPPPEHGWIDNRFWVWAYFTALKIARGELFEAIDFLTFLRSKVLGPLALEQAGARPIGVRRLELLAPAFAQQLKRTVPHHDPVECVMALRVTVDLYRLLREQARDGGSNNPAESAVIKHLGELERRYGCSR